jgi:hypothetical protein
LRFPWSRGVSQYGKCRPPSGCFVLPPNASRCSVVSRASRICFNGGVGCVLCGFGRCAASFCREVSCASPRVPSRVSSLASHCRCRALSKSSACTGLAKHATVARRARVPSYGLPTSCSRRRTSTLRTLSRGQGADERAAAAARHQRAGISTQQQLTGSTTARSHVQRQRQRRRPQRTTARRSSRSTSRGFAPAADATCSATATAARSTRSRCQRTQDNRRRQRGTTRKGAGTQALTNRKTRQQIAKPGSNDDELSTITDATDADSDSTLPPKLRSRKG